MLVRTLVLCSAWVVAACDWPQSNPYDPQRCQPSCAAGTICYEGQCVAPDLDLGPRDAAEDDGPPVLLDGPGDAPLLDGPAAPDGPGADGPADLAADQPLPEAGGACGGDSDCPADLYGPWSSCVYASTCNESGSRTRTRTSYTCDLSSQTCVPSAMQVAGTCTRSTDGNSCAVDNDSCTDDVCAAGACTHPALPEGSQCTNEGTTGANYLCCAGACRYTMADAQHCGGCYVACGGSVTSCNAGYCRACANDAQCSSDVSNGFECNTAASANRCQCTDNSSCPKSWQHCNASHQCRGIAP